MTGIRRRISIAFLSIVGLLFASGMISFFELSHLSYDTEEILKANQRNVELAKEMLGAVHDQNVAIVHLAILQDASYDSLCRTGMQRLEHAVATAQKGALDRSALDSLTGATCPAWGRIFSSSDSSTTRLSRIRRLPRFAPPILNYR